MKTPQTITDHMRSLNWTEAQMREYVIEELAFYAALPDKTVVQDEDGWIAFKLGCTVPEAKKVIRWAENQ